MSKEPQSTIQPYRLPVTWEGSVRPPSRRARALAALLFPAAAVWTLPQTVAGLSFALFRRLQGEPIHLYRFGPFLFLVVRTRGPASLGISLGVVIFAEMPTLLKHEFCHIITGLWLSWLYLPVYGLEYLVLGHDRSMHERITCWLERTVPWDWERVWSPSRRR